MTVRIVGVGETAVGLVPELSATRLYSQAIQAALGDAGLKIDDVDLLMTGNSRAAPFMYHAEAIAEHMGMTPRDCFTVTTGGASTISAIAAATAMIESGHSDVCVIAMADSLRTGMGKGGAIESMATVAHPVYEHVHAPTVPSLYALIAQRYVREYRIPAGDIAAAVLSDREFARLNPAAQIRDEITIEDVLASPMIADPIRRAECAPISDGGCAIVLARQGTYDATGGRDIDVLGSSSSSWYEHVSQAPTFTESPAGETSRRALGQAGRSLVDVDVAMIYDAFAFMLCMGLEDLGFCAKGQGGVFVAAGETRLGGRIPTNTHGGVLAHSHAGRPSSLFLVVEAVHQLRGECGPRQAGEPTTALVHSSGGISSSHGTLIVGRRDA